MASTVPDSRYERRLNVTDRRRLAPAAASHAARLPLSVEGMRVTWGGVWGGVLTAVGLLLLLAALGVAVGITAADPRSTDAATAGTAAAIWAGASLLIALFIGGMVSTRAGAIHDRATGFWEGFLVWIVSLLLMAYLATTGMASLASGTMQLMGAASQAAQATGQAAAQPAAPAVDPNAAVEQLKSKVQEVTGGAGGLQQRAADAKPAASRAAWFTFGGLVLSLLAALAGAMVGRRRTPVIVR